MSSVENRRSFDVIDTTLRDGLQSPEVPEHGKYSLAIPERLEIFTALVQYGVRFVEVFSPLVNSTERESLARIITRRDELIPGYGYTYILGHVRCDEKDVAAAISSGVDGLNLYMGTSKMSQDFNHGKDLSEVAARSKNLIEEIRRNYPHLQLRFSGEDAFRTPIDDLYRVYDGLADTVDRFGMPDTVGTATPDQVHQRVRLLQSRYPEVALEGHFHNDRGFAGINAVTAALAGMRYVDTSVLGLAERSGITSQTALLFNLFLEKPELLQGYSLEDSYALNVLVASIMEMQVPYTEPISLTNNTHSAGVHTSAMLKNSSVYQAHPLEKFGITETRLLLGPLSGWHVVNYYLTHILNYEGVTPDIAKAVTSDFKDECSRRHVKENPTEILNKIAAKFNLEHKNKPQTHIENL
jgi:homocitrate synthase